MKETEGTESTWGEFGVSVCSGPMQDAWEVRAFRTGQTLVVCSVGQLCYQNSSSTEFGNAVCQKLTVSQPSLP